MIDEKLGKYTILEVVGHGNMGTVYKAEDPEGRPVAVKRIRSQVLYNMEKRERFLQYILVVSEIRHKGICPIMEIGDEGDDFFVIMPWINGKTLRKYLERMPLSCAQALDVALEAGAAVAVLHDAGIAHRGLKPANIWLLNDREHTVMLSDCGIAPFTEIAERGRLRTSGRTMDFADTLIPQGALAYMSPEQVKGEPVDHRADIFSFGVILYEMLSGRHPFEAHNSLSQISAILEAEPPAISSTKVDIPPDLEPVIRKAMARVPRARFQNMMELLSALQAARQKSLSPRMSAETRATIRKWFSLRLWRGST